MAHGWLEHLLGSNHKIFSAGLDPQKVHPLAIQVMGEIGVDISAYRSNHVSEYREEKFDYVITVCDRAKQNCPIFPAETAMLHWPFADPAAVSGTEGERLSFFRKIRDEIGLRVKGWISTVDRPQAI